MKISKTLFALFSASLVTTIWAVDEYKSPGIVMKNVEPVKNAKTANLEEKFRIENAVEEGRGLASEDALLKEEENREPSSVQKEIHDEKVTEMPKFWNHKKNRESDY